MKRNIIILPIIALLLSAVGFSAATAESGGQTALRAYYQDCINTCIMKLDSKAHYKNSECRALQREALMAAMKKMFLQRYQERLINKMVEEDIGQKNYKIEYYLDRQFYRVIHPRLALK